MPDPRKVCCCAVTVFALASPVRGQQPTIACDTAITALVQHAVVDEETRIPLRGANIRAVWRAAEGDRQFVAQTDSAGQAFLCLPQQNELVVHTLYRGVQGSSLRTVLDGRAFFSQTATVLTPHVSVRGQVVDHSTGAPVTSATARLIHTSLSGLTDAEGNFAFLKVPIGEYRLAITHVAYATTDAQLLTDGNDLLVRARLVPQAIRLPPVVVTTISRRLQATGFYERQKRGIGVFIDRHQVEAARAQFPSDLLRNVPGVRLVPTTPARNASRNRTIGRTSCRHRFILDGARAPADFELDNLPATAIEGLEIYAGSAQLPAELRARADGPGAICGVIVVWTKDGR